MQNCVHWISAEFYVKPISFNIINLCFCCCLWEHTRKCDLFMKHIHYSDLNAANFYSLKQVDSCDGFKINGPLTLTYISRCLKSTTNMYILHVHRKYLSFFEEILRKQQDVLIFRYNKQSHDKIVTIFVRCLVILL